MKKSLLILALAAMGFVACTKSGVAPTKTGPANSPTIGSLARRDAVDHDANDTLERHNGKDERPGHDLNDNDTLRQRHRGEHLPNHK